MSISPTLTTIPSDCLLEILGYLSAIDSGAVKVSRRLLMLQEKKEQMQPSLSTAASASYDPRATIRKALSSLSGRPTLAFVFSTDPDGAVVELEGQLPHNCVVLSAQPSNVQSNLGSKMSCDDEFSIMVGSFPEARPIPFAITQASSIESTVNDKFPEGEDVETIVVYSVGDGGYYTEETIKRLQDRFPNASIIGGICNRGQIRDKLNFQAGEGNEDDDEMEGDDDDTSRIINSMTVRQLKMLISAVFGDAVLATLLEKSELVSKAFEAYRIQNKPAKESSFSTIDDGVFGIAIGGKCPLRSVVSRGVRSTISGEIAVSRGGYYCNNTVSEVNSNSEGTLVQVRRDSGHRA